MLKKKQISILISLSLSSFSTKPRKKKKKKQTIQVEWQRRHFRPFFLSFKTQPHIVFSPIKKIQTPFLKSGIGSVQACRAGVDSGFPSVPEGFHRRQRSDPLPFSFLRRAPPAIWVRQDAQAVFLQVRASLRENPQVDFDFHVLFDRFLNHYPKFSISWFDFLSGIAVSS